MRATQSSAATKIGCKEAATTSAVANRQTKRKLGFYKSSRAFFLPARRDAVRPLAADVLRCPHELTDRVGPVSAGWRQRFTPFAMA